jgi:hypothetical protein
VRADIAELHVSRGSGYFPMAAAKRALEVAIRYLAVDAGRWVTGQVVTAEGGLSPI